MTTTQSFDRETLFGWHTDLSIGPVPPASFGWKAIPGKNMSWLFWTQGSGDPEGKKYPAVEFYSSMFAAKDSTALGLPIQTGKSQFSLCYDLTVSDEAIANGSVIETDIILVDENGFKHNLSLQRHIATGQIDIGNWTDTTIRAGSLTADVRIKIKIDYSFDRVLKICSVLGYSDGTYYPIPARFQKMPATACNWAKGRLYDQWQLGSKPAGLPWAIKITNPEVVWP